LENTERAVRRFIGRLGGPEGLAVAYEAGPGGFALFRLLSALGVACDIIAPSLVPVRAGDRVKTDRRDAKKLARLYRAGELTFVMAPTPEQEGLRDLVRCRETCAMRARGRVTARSSSCCATVTSFVRASTGRCATAPGCAPSGSPIRWRRSPWSRCSATWTASTRRSPRSTVQLARVARQPHWAPAVKVLCAFRGVSVRTALGLLAEIGDFRRFGTARELMSYLGLVPSEYSSGQERHRGHITKAGPKEARRLLIEAAWHYHHRPRLSARQRAANDDLPASVPARAWRAQIRLNHRHRTLAEHHKPTTVANTAVARELAGFLWAAMTDQPLRTDDHRQEVAAA
jgi:transposase